MPRQRRSPPLGGGHHSAGGLPAPSCVQQDDATAGEEESRVAGEREEDDAAARSWRRRPPELEEEAESRRGTSISAMEAVVGDWAREAARVLDLARQLAGRGGEQGGRHAARLGRRPDADPRWWGGGRSACLDLAEAGCEIGRRGRWFADDDKGATAADGCGSVNSKAHLTGGHVHLEVSLRVVRCDQPNFNPIQSYPLHASTIDPSRPRLPVGLCATDPCSAHRAPPCLSSS
jgi:hypothetical protein